jgi:EmrB/QacA subfamily drug resistance transporter
MLDRSRSATLVLLCAASFVAVADTTIVTIALPSLRDALGMSAPGVQWVLNGYALVFGGLLLLCGRLADLHGRRRLFVVGLTVFLAGSTLAGLAPGGGTLVLGRALQGAGAAGFVPASLALLTSTFTDRADRGRAIGAYGAMAAVGFVVGMLGGGVITELWGWRWVFLVNVPVAALMLLAAPRVLHESRPDGTTRRLDVLGALTATSGVLLLVFALTSVPQRGVVDVLVWGCAATGVLLLVIFVGVEQRHPDPLLPPELVRRAAVLVPNGAIALQSMVGIGWLYLLTLYLQEVRGHGPLATGLLFLPMTIAAMVASPVAGRLTAGLGARATASTGLAVVAAGICVMAVGTVPAVPAPVMVAGMVVGESGFMLSNVALTYACTSGFDDDRSGLAAGLLNTSTQLGSGWGLAVVAVVLAAGGHAGPTVGTVSAAAVRGGLLACGVFCLVALVLVLRHLPTTARDDRRDAGSTR